MFKNMHRVSRTINGILYFYNEADGHHYTKTYDEWIAYPTNADGSIDLDCILYLDDMILEAEICPLSFCDDCDKFLKCTQYAVQTLVMKGEQT